MLELWLFSAVKQCMCVCVIYDNWIAACVFSFLLPLAGFWDMFDPEGYSLWFCDYKYNDENTVSFVTSLGWVVSCNVWIWLVSMHLGRC